MSFNNEYFRQFYGDYYRQNPVTKLRSYLRLIRKVVPSGRLLDIGCSYGLFVQEAAAFFSCTGMDVDREVVAMAASKVPNASFIAGALPHIPCRDMDVI